MTHTFHFSQEDYTIILSNLNRQLINDLCCEWHIMINCKFLQILNYFLFKYGGNKFLSNTNLETSSAQKQQKNVAKKQVSTHQNLETSGRKYMKNLIS